MKNTFGAFTVFCTMCLIKIHFAYKGNFGADEETL